MGRIFKVNGVIGERGFVVKAEEHGKCLKNRVD